MLELRFVEDMTQSEIAERIGVSQMQVSRLLRHALEQLRILTGASAGDVRCDPRRLDGELARQPGEPLPLRAGLPIAGARERHYVRLQNTRSRARRRIINEQPNVVVALDGRAENVALVREVLAGLADEVDFGFALDDVKAAVSEACNNVVVHAYEGAAGPLEVEVRLRPPELEVLVRDRGVGIRDGEGEPAAGIGLAVIEALTIRSELRENADRGLEVAMVFDIPEPEAPADLPDDGTPPATQELGGDGELEVAIAITPAALGPAVLNRIVSALAARAGFSIDRLSDAQLVTDALAARVAPVLDGGYLNVGIEVLERTVALRVGHLREGGSASLLAGETIGEPGPLIERLTDAIEVSQAGTREMLRLVMRDARPAANGAA